MRLRIQGGTGTESAAGRHAVDTADLHPTRNLTIPYKPTFSCSSFALATDHRDRCSQTTWGTLSRVLNCRAAISPEMALRIEKWLGVENGGSADTWIAQHWQARQAGSPTEQRAVIPH